MSRRLPLFVLNIVLFPGVLLPLHVFEPRYQRLLEDALAGDGCFGVVPPGAAGEEPAPGALGCVAKVVSNHPMPDGQASIAVMGQSRFVLQRTLETPREYFVGVIEEFDDDEGMHDLPGDAAAALRHFADRCRAALGTLTGRPSHEPWAADAATLTFQIAATVPWSAEQAHALLAMRSTAERADTLLHVLPQVVPDLERRATVHRRAAGNGKGGHAPELDADG